MRLDRFDLNLLVVLDILLEERNVTRASERLNLGQSATSAALARLRVFFDDGLLVQVGRRLELTPLAKSLVGPVRETLNHARTTMSLKATFDPTTTSRRFTIHASDHLVETLFAAVMRELADSAPGIQIDLRRPPKQVLDVFDRGNIDLLVIPEQYAANIQHPQTLLFSDDQVCLVHRESFSGIESLSMDDYMALGHVAIRFGEESSIAFEDWFLPRYGRQRRVECTVEYFGVVPHLLIGTRRVATLHRRIATQMASQFPLRCFEAPFAMQPLKEVLVWPKFLDGDPCHQWLRELIARHAEILRKRVAC
ncbi:LysR family transcriptional regulator [Agrobacterium vitis]|uniref:LysR family transcriptional regulator n=1 Tax=Agrobacterium vitis TaxID=373 RepID=A0A6I4G8H4_AGRVI|nr:LysR family transcriptional regulator [Agrobacterium vitis]MVA59597.1 LysR family transcriptional regulator [Agrobacterium vitis]MVA82651.1 LysR family transcriptional regulator [Agrobacterium vitis]